MEITYYGHSCFLVTIGNTRLLFDPFIKGNPLAAGTDIHSITADYILVSHAHSDHLADAMEIGKRNNAKLISNFEVDSWFTDKGWGGGHGMNHGGKLQMHFGNIRYVPAIHSSAFPDGSYGGNPGGFVVESPEGNFYYAGDTALSMEMKLIPLYAKISFAFLPIGGYFTMDATDATLAADFIECNRIIGMHFDSFPAIKINHQEAIQLFNSKGKELIIPQIGKRFSI